MPPSRLHRRLIAGASLLALSAAAVAVARSFREPYQASAPSYRQRGGAGAPVVLAEFSDFQCPHCAMAVEPLKQLQALYGDRLREVFKYLPWERVHPHARAAAVAAECAGKQDKFWPFHDLLFARQDEWGLSKDPDTSFEAYARKLRLDLGRWNSCRKDPASQAAVDLDVEEAKRHWIHSTPTFFVNGKRYVGVPQLRFKGVGQIERALATGQ